MIEVDSNGIMTMTGSGYVVVDITNFIPNQEIFLEVLQGGIEVYWPLDDFFYEGDSVSFIVSSEEDQIRVSSMEDTTRFLLKYADQEEEECKISYDMEAIVPIAVSSELSHTGEERIHIAPAIELPPPPPIPEHKMVVDYIYMYPYWEE